MDLHSLVAAAPRRTWTGSRGSLEFIRVPPRVGIIQCEGRISDESLPLWQHGFSWMVSDDMSLFLDGERLVRVTALVTATGTSQVIEARQAICELHVLVSSPLIESLAKTVNFSIGGFMRLHRDRQAYERELARVLSAQGGLSV